MELPKILKIYNQVNQFGITNGMHYEVKRPGVIHYYWKVQSDHLSSPGVAHGGAVAGFMDAILGVSALSVSAERNELVATVEFKIQYIRPIFLNDELEGIGEVEYRGNRIILASAVIHNQKGEKVAMGTGTFNAYPASKSAVSEYMD
ncbi:PaaI family thioesterase [Luteibaculum oceani]|uniref:PaaI family thioesterase n=1 Tax=Luteibaculum oceani TaxID=1294296 RepID=A0A5C6V1I9_9FLAO|nr:PaaI family thioesterase [Luteibaculum oceani]TXC78531.1 PaaI family thioesterase [Luteibaculum oceani]